MHMPSRILGPIGRRCPLRALVCASNRFDGLCARSLQLELENSLRWRVIYARAAEKERERGTSSVDVCVCIDARGYTQRRAMVFGGALDLSLSLSAFLAARSASAFCVVYSDFLNRFRSRREVWVVVVCAAE